MVIAKTMQMGPLLCLLERNENSQLHAKSFDIQIPEKTKSTMHMLGNRPHGLIERSKAMKDKVKSVDGFPVGA